MQVRALLERLHATGERECENAAELARWLIERALSNEEALPRA